MPQPLGREVRRAARWAAFSLLLGGCMAMDDFEPPSQELPDSFPRLESLSDSSRSGDGAADWTGWWMQFGDPTLDRLVRQAMDGNQQIHLQLARIQEAHARFAMSRADPFPQLDAQADAVRERSAQPGTTLSGAGGLIYNAFSLSAMLHYEVDLWGRLAGQQEAAAAILDQSLHSHDAIRLAIVTEVVTTYFAMKTAQQQQAIAERNLAALQRTLELERLRHEHGDVDLLAVRQAEAAIATARTELPRLRQQVMMLESALGLLTGQDPRDMFAAQDFGSTTLSDLQLPDGVPDVLPSELLLRRPDIRAAEAELRAAHASAEVAVAERLPRLNLSSMLGQVRLDAGQLFNETLDTWRVGASVAGPVLDFGRGEAHVDVAQARRAQAEARYRNTVLTAFSEVRDALITHQSSEEQWQAIRQQVDALSESHELARIRHDGGLISMLDLLATESSLLNAELRLSDARRNRLSAIATLFKALGGGWEARSEADGLAARVPVTVQP